MARVDLADLDCGVVESPPPRAARAGLIALTATPISPDTRAWRTALATTAAAGLLRLVLAAVTPLFPDETYYWEWSRRLAAGYFDHPPVIAWLIRAGTLIFGDSPLGVRLGAVVAGAMASVFVCASARRLAGGRAALITALVFALMPLSAAGLVLATPDAPLFAAAAGTLFAVLRALEAPPRSRAAFLWWCASGVALGVALSSKYTAVLLPAGVAIGLAANRNPRGRLREAGPYAATAIALVVFFPVIAWNARHDWVSFAFQLQHGLGGVAGSVLRRELDLLGGQLALVTPILFVLMVIAATRAFRQPSPGPMLATVAAVIFAFFAYSASKRRAEANWPALAYIPALLLLATHTGGIAWSRWLNGGIVLAGALTAVAYVNSVVPVLPVPARRDPVARSAGWSDLARAVDGIYAPRLPISSYRTWVGADRYQEASELAFHLPSRPGTFSVNLTTRANQYDLWPRFADLAHPGDALILVLDEVNGDHPTIERLTPHFETVSAASSVTLARDGDPVKHLRIWRLERWLGTWPGARIGSR